MCGWPRSGAALPSRRVSDLPVNQLGDVGPQGGLPVSNSSLCLMPQTALSPHAKCCQLMEANLPREAGIRIQLGHPITATLAELGAETGHKQTRCSSGDTTATA